VAINPTLLMYRNPSRLDPGMLVALISRPQPGAHPMMDVLMLAIAFGLFAVGIGYAYVCERL
jgi:hypothetical protein